MPLKRKQSKQSPIDATGRYLHRLIRSVFWRYGLVTGGRFPVLFHIYDHPVILLLTGVSSRTVPSLILLNTTFFNQFRLSSSG
jgi:hypothetical protein